VMWLLEPKVKMALCATGDVAAYTLSVSWQNTRKS